MSEKTEQLNMKLPTKAKRLLKLAADKEHRNMTNMVEHLIYDYCEKNGISDDSSETK